MPSSASTGWWNAPETVAAEHGQATQDEIDEEIKFFKNSVFDYASILETGDEQFDLANADSVPWEDGWCYPNDVFDCIYEFTSNVAMAVDGDEEEIFFKEN